MIILAELNDAKALTNIALKSKAFWGYSDDLIESWREDLTITPQMFREWNVYKYVVDHKIIGFYILNRANIRTSFIEFLFVAPNFINKGIGKQLMQHAIKYCTEGSCAIINVLSDPNAAAFYEKCGFKVIAERESSILGRYLPEMEFEIISNT